MTVSKPKIVIIEDQYSQYKIISDLLKRDYDVYNETKTLKTFNSLKAKLYRLLKDIDTDFIVEMNNFENVSAFVVDYELKEDSKDKTGILFCQKTDCISNGITPVLFLTKNSEDRITNRLTIVENEIAHIKYKFSRKPQLWADENKKVEDIISDSIDFYNSFIKNKIDELLKQGKQSTIEELCNEILQNNINLENEFTSMIESIKLDWHLYTLELVTVLKTISYINNITKSNQTKFLSEIKKCYNGRKQ